MQLFILKPVNGRVETGAWNPWYDKAFGFVVRAPDDATARRFASNEAGNEEAAVWLDPTQTTCDVLTHEGDAGVILRDFASA